jgi:Ca2+-transporting ATPase
MKKPPRDSKAGIFSEGMGVDILYQGFLIAALTVISYYLGYYVLSPKDASHGMTMAFLTLSLSEVFHCLNMRSQRKSLFSVKTFNLALVLAAVGSLAATILVCEVPFLAEAFSLAKIGGKEYLVAIGLAFSMMPIVEFVKFLQSTFAKKRQK